MAKSSSSQRLDFEAPIIELEKKIEELRTFAESTEVDLSGQIEKLVKKCDEKKRAIFNSLTPWQKIQLARHPQRPLTTDIVKAIVADFIELYGDKSFRDDPAILCGLGRIDDQRVLLVGHRKGKCRAPRKPILGWNPHEQPTLGATDEIAHDFTL